MDELNKTWCDLITRLDGVKGNNETHAEACCPAHNDSNPSLSISLREDRILLICHAGCSFQNIIRALDMGSHSFSLSNKTNSKIKKEINRYTYENIEGKKVYEVVRYEPKDFRLQRPDGKWTIEGVQRVPYRLPQMLAAIKKGNDILLLEGEKDCDNAIDLGLHATTFLGGAGKWKDVYLNFFNAANIICIPDNDETGIKGMHKIAERIKTVAKKVVWLELPNLKIGDDFSDWIKTEDNNIGIFKLLARNAPDWDMNSVLEMNSPQHQNIQQNLPLTVLSLDQLLKKEIPVRQNLLSPWLEEQGLCMIYSKRGLGKTWFALMIAHAVATGGKFLKWKAPNPAGVLYIDGEMPLASMQERLAQIVSSQNYEIKAPLRFVTPDVQEFGIPDLSTQRGQSKIDELITEETKLIVLDNLSTLIRAGKENEGESWVPVQEWVLRLRANGLSVLFIHHAGKTGTQRGTSRREDILDTVITLKEPSNYNQENGACFEIHFEKNRALYGDAVKPFEVKLEIKENENKEKNIEWIINNIEDSTRNKVKEYLEDEWTKTDIAHELGITKSSVSYHVNKLGMGKSSH